ncbi:thiol-activated cytolysin family protein [Arcanobacterium bovis]|uniref:Thiol-activated cytolysin C-terminal domain-containing protein n=1 Tax=Arcanobacterium bovis TaxID=2529275 RepID=A0A4Q9V0D1_9ACTO|nr:thiol-activated cytolysin family protein [Arcanobacterium bovis]TBW22109.1 hypothetical protein EZJ44_04585 [Arcanobacterium bovis]
MKRKFFATVVSGAFVATAILPTTALASSFGDSALITPPTSEFITTMAPNMQIANGVDQYIRGLQYDPRGVLAVPGESVKTVPVTRDQFKDGTYTVFKHERKSFNNLRSDIAALEANNATIFPGALVLANQSLAKGTPIPVGIDRAPQTISVDLPGSTRGSNRITIQNPSKSTVEQGINDLLQRWTDRHDSYPEHAAKMSYDESMVTSKEQLKAKFGLGFEKIAAKLNVNFEAIHKHERQVAIASFRQIYYTVAMDTPTNPHKVFAPNVTRDDLVARGVNNKNPLGYVSSVSYGRQIFVKLETTSTSNDVKAAFNGVFKASFGNVKTDVDTKYANILKNTRATVYVMGGSAKRGVEVATGNIADLKRIIKEESTFSTNVPAVPVSYAVNFLKDNQQATVQNSGDYIETTATTYTAGAITLRHAGGYVAKFDLTWDEISFDAKGNEIRTPMKWSGNWKARTAGFRETIHLPANARNIRVVAGEGTGLAWDPWWTIINQKGLPLVPHREIVLKGTTLNPWVENNTK